MPVVIVAITGLKGMIETKIRVSFLRREMIDGNERSCTSKVTVEF